MSHSHYSFLDDYSCLYEEEDVHVLTGALKMFFREMKEPLFPFNMFDKFLHAIGKLIISLDLTVSLVLLTFLL